MKRVFASGVIVYTITWLLIAVAYTVAWLTDFRRGE